MRWSERLRQRDLAARGSCTPTPEPPGEGDWNTAVGDFLAFVAAGRCELWRMDQGNETWFGQFSDFPPEFNLSGLWWRKA